MDRQRRKEEPKGEEEEEDGFRGRERRHYETVTRQRTATTSVEAAALPGHDAGQRHREKQSCLDHAFPFRSLLNALL